MNNFPAMTEERRQKLIAECENEIAELTQSIQRCDAIGTADYLMHLQSQFLRQQVALSALTAEPAGKFYAGPKGKVSIHPSEALPLGFNPFYTAPPAPVLRLPGEVSCEGLDPQEADEARNLGQCEGWNACLAEVKRLNSQPAPPEASNEQ